MLLSYKLDVIIVNGTDIIYNLNWDILLYHCLCHCTCHHRNKQVNWECLYCAKFKLIPCQCGQLHLLADDWNPQGDGKKTKNPSLADLYGLKIILGNLHPSVLMHIRIDLETFMAWFCPVTWYTINIKICGRLFIWQDAYNCWWFGYDLKKHSMSLYLDMQMWLALKLIYYILSGKISKCFNHTMLQWYTKPIFTHKNCRNKLQIWSCQCTVWNMCMCFEWIIH